MIKKILSDKIRYFFILVLLYSFFILYYISLIKLGNGDLKESLSIEIYSLLFLNFKIFETYALTKLNVIYYFIFLTIYLIVMNMYIGKEENPLNWKWLTIHRFKNKHLYIKYLITNGIRKMMSHYLIDFSSLYLSSILVIGKIQFDQFLCSLGMYLFSRHFLLLIYDIYMGLDFFKEQSNDQIIYFLVLFLLAVDTFTPCKLITYLVIETINPFCCFSFVFYLSVLFCLLIKVRLVYMRRGRR